MDKMSPHQLPLTFTITPLLFLTQNLQPTIMAATATATATAAGSALSSPIRTSRNEPLSVRFRRFSQPPSSSLSLSHHSSPIFPLPLPALFHKWRIFAAVTQEEALVTAEEEEEEKEKEGEVVVKTKLYIGNLPFNVDSYQLSAMIKQFATPGLVQVLYDRQTGKSRGCGFATMSTLDDCNTVIDNLDGSEFMGRILKVNYSHKPKPKGPLYPETDYKLFVGSLSWSVTAESLKKLFEQHGEVVGARVLYDGRTGKPRGFGFVCYATREQMEAAIEALNGVKLEGRPIRVKVAEGMKS